MVLSMRVHGALYKHQLVTPRVSITGLEVGPACVNYRSGGGTLGFAPPAAGEAGPVSASLMVQCYTCLKEKRV